MSVLMFGSQQDLKVIPNFSFLFFSFFNFGH